MQWKTLLIFYIGITLCDLMHIQVSHKIHNNNAKKADTVFERKPAITITLIIIFFIIILDFLFVLIFIHGNQIFRVPNQYYHHDLKPNFQGMTEWGYYPWQRVCTNSLGFRDRYVRDIPRNTSKKRIIMIGDSFTEGLRVNYDETFTGWLSNHIDNQKTEILNAGVSSYSPKLYYLKTKYLIEEAGLQFDEIYVFIDISDAQDEILYKDFSPIRFENPAQLFFYNLKVFLKRHSFIYNRLTNLTEKYRSTDKYINYEGGVFSYLSNEALSVLRDPYFIKHRQTWTLDSAVYQTWGKKGLSLGAENMQKLYDLCRTHRIKLTVVVYPSPTQILSLDIDSIQVLFWRMFCEEHNITFINLFPVFIPKLRQTVNDVIDRYFIKGDIHWNAEGHKLVGETILPYIGR